jgi:nitroreductase
VPGEDKLYDSAHALTEKFDRMPAILIPLMPGRVEGKTLPEQAPMWGSIIQAVWSFMLALRERGLGSTWVTATTRREREIGELLGIPVDQYSHVGMFPVAYTIGTDFKRAWRKPVSEVLTYNRF